MKSPSLSAVETPRGKNLDEGGSSSSRSSPVMTRLSVYGTTVDTNVTLEQVLHLVRSHTVRAGVVKDDPGAEAATFRKNGREQQKISIQHLRAIGKGTIDACRLLHRMAENYNIRSTFPL